MGSDREEFLKKKREQRNKRKSNEKKRAPYRYLIVSEGEKTETNYFNGIKSRINKEYNNTVDVKKMIELQIEGAGRNTNDLVNNVDNYLYSISQYVNRSTLPIGHIWVIFDKDDFRPEQFNSAITTAQNRGYYVGWSNESFELWLLLHFEDLKCGLHRTQYNDKLTKYFRDKKIPKKFFPDGNVKYDKNIELIYEIVCTYGNSKKALDRAKKLMEYYKSNCQVNPTLMNPCTTVYKLFEELENYLK